VRGPGAHRSTSAPHGSAWARREGAARCRGRHARSQACVAPGPGLWPVRQVRSSRCSTAHARPPPIAHPRPPPVRLNVGALCTGAALHARRILLPGLATTSLTACSRLYRVPVYQCPLRYRILFQPQPKPGSLPQLIACVSLSRSSQYSVHVAAFRLRPCTWAPRRAPRCVTMQTVHHNFPSQSRHVSYPVITQHVRVARSAALRTHVASQKDPHVATASCALTKVKKRCPERPPRTGAGLRSVNQRFRCLSALLQSGNLDVITRHVARSLEPSSSPPRPAPPRTTPLLLQAPLDIVIIPGNPGVVRAWQTLLTTSSTPDHRHAL